MYKFPDNIFALIRSERDEFLDTQIEIVPGYTFNQYDTIKKIHLYYNSRFVDGNVETVNGVKRPKVFYNVSKWRASTWSKQIDLDTSNLILISKDPDTEWQVNLLEKELKAWMEREEFGQVLNDISRYLPIYGTAVLKKCKDEAELVDLRNLMLDQSVKCMEDSRYIIQRHYMTPSELRKKKGVWKDTQEAIDKYGNYSGKMSYTDDGTVSKIVSPYIEVYERWGEVPLSWVTGKEKDQDEYVTRHYIVAGAGDRMQNDQGLPFGEDGVILFEEDYEELPFMEVHASRTEGRWLGIGVVEDTFEAQRMTNRIRNLQDRSLELASTVAFQTDDNTVVNNILTDIANGEIIISKSGINRLDTTQKSVGELVNAAQDYEKLADRISFAADLMSGEIPPASTTATAVVNTMAQATSVFDYIKENVGLFLKEFITELVFPQLEKEINKKHLFRYIGSRDDMKILREKIADTAIRNAIENMHPNDVGEAIAMRDQMKQQILLELESAAQPIFVDVQKDFYKNLEYNLDLAITNESINTQVRVQNTQAVLGMLSQNPELLNNPMTRRLAFRLMADIGMSVSELEMLEKEMAEATAEQMQQQQMAEGGVPAPTPEDQAQQEQPEAPQAPMGGMGAPPMQ